MMRKTLLLLLGYFALSIFIACERCPDDDATYYDFNIIEINYPFGSALSAEDSLYFIVQEWDINYLSNLQLNVFSAAYATDCVSPLGRLGKKYPIMNFTVTSNADWDEEHPAGSSLNDIAIVPVLVPPSQPPLRLSQVLSGEVELQYYLEGNGHALKMPPPLADKVHQFTITIEKQNGEIIQATTEEVRWQ